MSTTLASPPVSQAFTLQHAVASILSDRPHRLAVSTLVTCCHRFALAYLFKKVRHGNFPGQVTGLSVDDLALDCIAEIFQRDGNGQFCVLHTYLKSHECVPSTDDELQIALRRLVFSKVNESLFRLYHETDPNLAKIIRNVKDAAKADPRFHLARHHRKQWLVVFPDEALISSDAVQEAITSRPMAPQELLETYFSSHFGQNDRVRELTGLFAAFVQAYPHYANAYPVTGFAQAMRASFVRTHEALHTENESVFHAFEITNAIQVVTDDLEAAKRPSYVGRGKVSDVLFTTYFDTIRDIIAGQYRDDLEMESYYTALQKYLPELSEDDYRSFHRNILEYLAKLARTNFLLYLNDRK